MHCQHNFGISSINTYITTQKFKNYFYSVIFVVVFFYSIWLITCAYLFVTDHTVNVCFATVGFRRVTYNHPHILACIPETCTANTISTQGYRSSNCTSKTRSLISTGSDARILWRVPWGRFHRVSLNAVYLNVVSIGNQELVALIEIYRLWNYYDRVLAVHFQKLVI